MSLGPIMLDIAGVELDQDDRELLCHPSVGGVILFSRNYQSRDQLHDLVDQIRSLRTPKLLVAVDHEGGRVQRFREGFTELPSAATYGQLYDEEPQIARQCAYAAGWILASELRAIGIDFSFAPVLDLDRNISNVIGDRAFHSSPEVVAYLAGVFMRAMNDAGMAATGKHFPGHGGVELDSHTDIPIDLRDYSTIFKEDIQVFTRLIEQGINAIMPAHVIYENVDSNAAGFSSFWLHEVLRERLGFSGMIFSDDLNMKAASSTSQDYSGRAFNALQAGCDMILICNNRPAAIEIINGRNYHINVSSQIRFSDMYGRKKIGFNELKDNLSWKKYVNYLQKYTEIVVG
ncbi:beta-N-acetylglucosaminidase [hydrothermal vent metagenome]|uniref:beta-N-acetylhexosaminidase n=1 Tax=hydrothermal vent metagenome TaxID=652676 RepID=A0A3B0ZPF2_9ZZZZ